MKELCRFIGLFLSITCAYAYSQQGDIVDKITISKQLLESESEKITQEKIRYSDNLEKLRIELKQLKVEAENIQRVEDEKSISLDSLQGRLERWEDQLAFQEHLFRSLSDFMGNKDTDKESEKVLSRSIEELQSYISPDWGEVNVALKSGDIITAKKINFGPVNLYFSDEKKIAGIYEMHAHEYGESSFEYSSGEIVDLEKLYLDQTGYITFDATQGKAFELLVSRESIIGHIKKGGIWVIPIILFGLTSMLLSFVKLKQVINIPSYSSKIIDDLEKVVSNRSINQIKSVKVILDNDQDPLRSLTLAIISEKNQEKREASLVNILSAYKHRVERHLDSISMVAAVAPLLGLLGTVSGMIETFKMLTIFGSGDPAAISGGISEALVTTELGLVVAIPSLIVNALLSRKIKSHLGKLERHVIRLNSSGDS